MALFGAREKSTQPLWFQSSSNPITYTRLAGVLVTYERVAWGRAPNGRAGRICETSADTPASRSPHRTARGCGARCRSHNKKEGETCSNSCSWPYLPRGAEGGEVMPSFLEVCIGWTLAFVLVVGSILILAQCGPEMGPRGRPDNPQARQQCLHLHLAPSSSSRASQHASSAGAPVRALAGCAPGRLSGPDLRGALGRRPGAGLPHHNI